VGNLIQADDGRVRSRARDVALCRVLGLPKNLLPAWSSSDDQEPRWVDDIGFLTRGRLKVCSRVEVAGGRIFSRRETGAGVDS
jgi:hypothetical protein